MLAKRACRVSKSTGTQRSAVCLAHNNTSTPLLAAQRTVAAALVAAGLVLTPAQPVQAAFSNLASIVAEQYSFVDSDKDGVIGKKELLKTAQEYADEIEMDLPSTDAIDFSLRLFDLNQDGKLTKDELLTSIVLEGAIDKNERIVDEEVVKVFDKNADGFVDLQEFRTTTPDLGPSSDAIKEYLFKRIDRLADNDGKLGSEEFINALSLFRTTVLGY